MLIFNLYLYCSGQGLNVDLIWEMKIEVKAADPSFAIELNFHFLEWPHRQAGRTNLVEHSKFTSNLQMIYKEKIEQYPLPQSIESGWVSQALRVQKQSSAWEVESPVISIYLIYFQMTQAPRVANIFELHKQSSVLEVESRVTPVLPIILLHFPMTHAFIVADLFQGCILLMPIWKREKFGLIFRTHNYWPQNVQKEEWLEILNQA